MKNTHGCTKPLAVIVILLNAVALIAVCAIVLVSLPQRELQARAGVAPPSVVVSEPASGASLPAGSHITVVSMAVGTRPISSVELWVDGTLQETQKSDVSGGVSPFYADFDLLMPPEGDHMLLVRAIDTAGLIGQSAMVGLVSEAKSDTTYMAVALQAGETLDDIAAANGVTLEILHELNSGLGSQPPPGSTVKVPAPSGQKGSEPAPSTPPPAQGGSVAIGVPNVPVMQIMSDRSTGLLTGGPFIANPLAGNISPPAAPTGLQVEVKDCKVMLRWDDNATDEENYLVYVLPLGNQDKFALPFAELKSSPGTGPAWYEFQPQGGGSYGISVEAANSYGSQPSNTVWVYIPYVSGCAPTVAQRLDINVLDVTVEGNFDKAYCYVSIENAPEQRLPVVGDFIALQGGKSQSGDFIGWYEIDAPKDGKMDLSGECWGWSGNDLQKLGTFSASFPPNTWNGSRQAVKKNNFEVGLSIQGAPLLGTKEMEAIDPTLPAPYDLHEDPPPAGYQATIPPTRILRWNWDGDPNKMDTYEIFLNGQPIPWSGWPLLKTKEYVARLPGECGQSVRWQVAVRVGTAISPLSAPFQYEQPPCQTYLRVRFDDIYLLKTDDGWPGDQCDTLDAYFAVSVRDVSRSFWNTNFVIPMKCGHYQFSDITGGPYKQLYAPEPNVITIPIAQDEDLGAIWIKARFWDSDSWSDDDLFATFAEHPSGAYVPKKGERWSGGGPSCYQQVSTGISVFDEARSSIKFSYSVFPNTCWDIPPAKGY